MVASWGRWSRRLRAMPTLVGVLVLALVAAVVVLGEPSRPATAHVVRPVVTVPALCSAPTVVDVAARDATRGLTAVGQLLGLSDELVGEAARDLSIVDTDAGAFFVLVRDGELRVAALSPAGLPIVNAEASPPQTYRAFALGDLAGRPSLVIGGPDGVFVVFGGADAPAEVFAITPATLASSLEVNVARDAGGPQLLDPRGRAGSAVVHEGVLWLAGDDGRVVTFDPLAEGSERWTERADGLVTPLLAQGDERVHGLFTTEVEGASLEVRSFTAEGAPAVTPVETAIDEVLGVNYPDSIRPVFAVRTGGGSALLRPAGAATTLVPGPPVDGDLLGLVATDEAAALLSVREGALTYEVLDAAGDAVGTFGGPGPERCVTGPWPDAAALIDPGSAGSLLHLHDPSGALDCVVDTRDRAVLGELTERCAAGGEWAVDKGSAPARDFTVEIGRALDELAADEQERDEDAEEPEGSSAEAIQEELNAAGLGVVETEVDAEAADECAVEQVTAVAPPVIDLAEPVGARAVRVEWSWSGGSCLPGRYLVRLCQLAEQATECLDATEEEVVADPTSARSSLELPARPDRTYRVTVRAAKGEVVSQPSGAVLVTTPAVTPDPPVDVSGSLQDGTWQLRWSSCLAAGDCDQRPDGFLVTVEGCEGDDLGQVRRRFDVSQRGISFGADGAGFGGVDLLGRHVRFRVATTSGERVSEPVPAGDCTASVRPGRDAPASTLGLSLTGRGRQVTLAALAGGRPLTELFGTARYDDVRARLVRGDFSSPSRTGLLSGSATFDVDRCADTGWTVELTPRLFGRDLPTHRSRLTDAVVACDPSVNDSTRIAPAVAGSSADGIDLAVTIPELGQDAANGLVEGVSATATCARAFGGEDGFALSGGAISGDVVAFTMPAPAVLDLESACAVTARVAFRGGGSATPAARPVDLRPARRAVVDAVLPVVVDRLGRARTGAYGEQRTEGGGNVKVVAVRHEGSGVPCQGTYGSSAWRFTVDGTPYAACADGAHAISYAEAQLDDDGGGPLRVAIQVGGADGPSASTTRAVPVCRLPGGDPRPPCAPEPCEFDPSLPADDPACFEPCEHDPTIPADDPGCFEPCEHDPTIPADDPACRPDPPPGGGDGGGGDGGAGDGGAGDGGAGDGGPGGGGPGDGGPGGGTPSATMQLQADPTSAPRSDRRG